VVREDLIHDWNAAAEASPPARPLQVMLNDVTLRDGVQSPSVLDPPIEKKIRLLHRMEGLGIEAANVGIPGAGARAAADVSALCREIRDAGLRIAPNCTARTLERDVEPIVEVSRATGVPIEVSLFIGSSAIRQHTEGWDDDFLLRRAAEAIAAVVKAGLPVLFVAEDTTRSKPETLRRLYQEAVRLGARRVVVADTTGHATPWGATAVVKFVRRALDEAGGREVGIDWHGHRDRGLALANGLAAFEAGASRVHGCALGVGERSGNMELDLMLVNLRLLGWIERDLTTLGEYCRTAADALGVPIPENYPVVGADAFETATGVHAAAVIKAFRKGDAWLADRVYSGVPAAEFGFAQRIRVGPMSGRSNVVFWLETKGIPATEERVARIFEAAKRSNRLLSDAEIEALV
jgi:2-isopropylmalate synthase